VAEAVARLIRGRLGEEIKLREQRLSTSNVEAWSLVQRAEQLRKNGEAAGTRDTAAMGRNFRAADSVLVMAEQLDPKWADAPALRALVAYNRSRLSGRDQMLIKQWVDVGVGHADRALALDANNADALETRGNLKYWAYLMGLEPDAAKSEALLNSAKEDLEAATRANPAQAGAWASLSHLYNQTGSGVDVNLAARRALEADAFLSNADQVLNRLFLSSYDLGQFPDASNWCTEMGTRFPESYQSPRCKLYMLTTRAEQPDVERAWRLADSIKSMVPEARKAYFELNSNLLVAAVLARAGQTDSALSLTGRSTGTAEVSPTRDLSLIAAFSYLQAGDKAKAIDQLKIYFAANDRMRKAYAEQPGWWFQSIAEDPGFKQLVGRT